MAIRDSRGALHTASVVNLACLELPQGPVCKYSTYMDGLTSAVARRGADVNWETAAQYHTAFRTLFALSRSGLSIIGFVFVFVSAETPAA